MRFVDDHATENKENEVPNKRFIHTKFGFDITLERRDPYGFIYVVQPKGPTPSVLSGAYSSFTPARLAVEQYISNSTFNEVVEEPVAPVEPLVYKKRKTG